MRFKAFVFASGGFFPQISYQVSIFSEISIFSFHKNYGFLRECEHALEQSCFHSYCWLQISTKQGLNHYFISPYAPASAFRGTSSLRPTQTKFYTSTKFNTVIASHQIFNIVVCCFFVLFCCFVCLSCFLFDLIPGL